MPVPGYTVIADNEIDPESPITTSLIFRLRDNCLNLLGVDPTTVSPVIHLGLTDRVFSDVTASPGYTVPAGVSVLFIDGVGPGGDGGNGSGGVATGPSGGGGGGASGEHRWLKLAVVAGDVIAWTINGTSTTITKNAATIMVCVKGNNGTIGNGGLITADAQGGPPGIGDVGGGSGGTKNASYPGQYGTAGLTNQLAVGKGGYGGTPPIAVGGAGVGGLGGDGRTSGGTNTGATGTTGCVMITA